MIKPLRVGEPTETHLLRPPLFLERNGENAEIAIAKINQESKELSERAAPLYFALSTIYKRITTLNRRRHELQTFVTVGVTRIPSGRKGEDVPKTEEELETYLRGLPKEALVTLLSTM